MKTILITVIASLLALTVTAAPAEVEARWDRANTAYVNADYQGAIAIYDSIAAGGYTNAKLYYNLGNAWFKAGGTGKAVLYYNRALKLAPSDGDVRYNLRVANTQVKDSIEEIPEFFLTRWMRAWRQTLSSNAWAVVSLVALALACAAVLFYLLSGSGKLRKLGFYLGVVFLFTGICAVVFSSQQKRELLHSTEAVIMKSAVSIKSSPDGSSKDLFILHEGTKVKVMETLNNWTEIMIADGNKGWVENDSFEVI